jgi:uncharacterized protein
MTAVEILRYADAKPVAWKNGGGLTRELASAPDDHAPGAFAWRISVADVDLSGDFSTFPGVDRVIVFVEGPSMILTVGAGSRELARFEPYAFDGGVAASCDVPLGPTRDLNIMTRRDRCTATVEVVDVDGTTTCETTGEGVHVLVALHDQVAVAGSGFGQVTLGRFDLLRVHGPLAVDLQGSGPVALIVIR